MRWFMVLLLVSPRAFARPSIASVDPEAVSRELDEARTRALEVALGDELTAKFQAAVLVSAFPQDAAEIDRELAKVDQAYRARGYRKEPAGGYRVTAPNGRDFTLATVANPHVVRVNGQNVYTSKSFRDFVADYSKALHRTFVVRHFPFSLFAIDAAEAIVHGLIGAVVVGLLVLYLDWSNGGFPGRVEQNYAKLASVCDNERAANTKFEKSISGTAYLDLLKKELALDVADRGCEDKIEITAVGLGAAKARFSDRERQKVCAARRQFVSCVDAYRSAAQPTSNVRMIEKSTSSSH